MSAIRKYKYVVCSVNNAIKPNGTLTNINATVQKKIPIILFAINHPPLFSVNEKKMKMFQ